MANFQARLLPEFTMVYPHLSTSIWYDVVPLFPELTERRVGISGERLTRIRGAKVCETLKGECFQFRKRPYEKSMSSESVGDQVGA